MFCTSYARFTLQRPFHLVLHILSRKSNSMLVPTLRGMGWMSSFRFKTIQNIEFLVFHVLREFCSFYAPRAFSPCCSYPLDEVTHYSGSHTPRKGMDAFFSFQNDSKCRVPCISRFARVLLVLRSKGVFTFLFISIGRSHTL